MHQSGGDPYIPRSWGGGCSAVALFKQLRERGMSKFEAARYIYTIIRTHPDVTTDPELPAPLEIIPHPDDETITIMAGKLVLDGSEVRMSTKRPAEIEVPDSPGRREQWDWNEERIYARNFYLRAIADGKGEPNIVDEVRWHIECKYGKDNVPSDRSLREHVQAWKEAGDYAKP